MKHNRIFIALCAVIVLFFSMCCMSIAGFAADDPVLQAGQWKCNSSVMTGDFTDLSAWPSGLGEVDLYFTSGGLSFMSMSCGYDLQTSKGNCLFYGDALVYSFGLTDPGWIQDAYAQIYFDADQEVSQLFYDWFTANFTYVGSDYEEPTFSMVINVYNTTGTALLASYSASGKGVSPAVTGVILADGLTITDASGKVWSWTGVGDADPFYGFALHPNFTLVAYDAGETFVAGGLAADYVLDLYLVTSLPPDNSDVTNNIFDLIRNVDFSFISDFFAEALDALFSFFGLRDLINDASGPFAWLVG